MAPDDVAVTRSLPSAENASAVMGSMLSTRLVGALDPAVDTVTTSPSPGLTAESDLGAVRRDGDRPDQVDHVVVRCLHLIPVRDDAEV